MSRGYRQLLVMSPDPSGRELSESVANDFIGPVQQTAAGIRWCLPPGGGFQLSRRQFSLTFQWASWI
jgi:hypothetical protein